MKSSRNTAALEPEREGILAVLQEQSTIDRIEGVIRELQLDDELTVTDTLDAALRRIPQARGTRHRQRCRAVSRSAFGRCQRLSRKAFNARGACRLVGKKVGP